MQSSREADARDQRARRVMPSSHGHARRDKTVLCLCRVRHGGANWKFFQRTVAMHFTVDMYQSGLTAPIPRTVYQYFSAYPLLPFLFPHFILFGSVQ